MPRKKHEEVQVARMFEDGDPVEQFAGTVLVQFVTFDPRRGERKQTPAYCMKVCVAFRAWVAVIVFSEHPKGVPGSKAHHLAPR